MEKKKMRPMTTANNPIGKKRINTHMPSGVNNKQMSEQSKNPKVSYNALMRRLRREMSVSSDVHGNIAYAYGTIIFMGREVAL